MNKIITRHPIFSHAKDIADICKPLLDLNISYFCHLNIDKNKQFSAINNHPDFTKYCIENNCFNVDINFENNHSNLPEFLVWDNIICGGDTLELYKTAGEHGIKHIFTIIQKSKNHCDLYHFASNQSSLSTNQIYYNNYDLLLMFIHFFKNMIKNSKQISQAYQLKIGLTQDIIYQPGLQKSIINAKPERINFISAIMNNILQDQDLTSLNLPLTKKELLCLELTVKGYTAEEIATLFYLSRRTIEEHLNNIKQKLGFKKKSELRKFFNI
jgi:DNA-binding CsgD family transcriptional regulator